MQDESSSSKITFRAFMAGVVFSAIFAALSVFFTNRYRISDAATQIPVLPYALLLLTVMLINPICRLVRFIRVFSPAEILIVFVMGLVASGIPSFGLTGHLIPIVGGLFNRSWNNEQSRWHRHVTPFLNDQYFVSEEGITEAAIEYVDLYEQHQYWNMVLDAATRHQEAKQHLEAAEEAWRRARADSPGGAGLEPDALSRNLEVARQNEKQARVLWEDLRDADPDLPAPDQAVLQGRAQLAQTNAEMLIARERMAQLEEKAFEKIELFRRGLPRHMRGYPGLIKLPEDTLGSYLSRVRRLFHGRRVESDLRQVQALIDSSDRSATPEIAERMERVRQNLALMSDATALRFDLDEQTENISRLNTEIKARQDDLREKHRSLREVRREERRSLERDIHGAQRNLSSLTRRREKAVENRDYLQQQWESLVLAVEMDQSAAELGARLADGELPADAGATVEALIAGLPIIDGDLRRFLIGDVPWGDWVKPLLLWLAVIFMTYLVLMTFNVLIFRQWAHNEKLIYPLAELPMFLAGAGSETGRLPEVFRGGLFWVGFLISGAFLGYNALVYTELIPGLNSLDLNNSWFPYLPNTPLAGLDRGKFARSHIFFTMIGLAFLIPKKVSFSLWFFAVLSMVQVLVLVGFGYGTNEGSFPQDWLYTLNFRSGQGFGALIVFSSAVLFKCRSYLFCAFAPAKVRDLPDDERRELRVSSFCFVFGSIGIVMTIWLSMGANLLHTIGSYLIIMLITIALIRAVAEGGILGFQAWVSPFHFIRAFFGMDKSFTSISMFAPLMVYYTMLFMDLKTFIAPAMANSLKIRSELKMRRGRFHAAIWTGVLVAVVVSILMSLMMVYSGGADVMGGGWFYTGLPRGLFNTIASISQVPPQASMSEAGWVVAGGVFMAALLYFRQIAFWLPHPLGMVMLVNPIMGAYWFSILLGWMGKTLVTKYGNKDTYNQARKLFIGLIVGELTIVIISMILMVALEIRIPIDLNRN